MSSKNPNLLKRLYENVMGTPEQNKKATEDMKDNPMEKKFQKAIGKDKDKEETVKPVEKKKGGSVTMASRRGDGCAVRGKTKAGAR